MSQPRVIICPLCMEIYDSSYAGCPCCSDKQFYEVDDGETYIDDFGNVYHGDRLVEEG